MQVIKPGEVSGSHPNSKGETRGESKRVGGLVTVVLEAKRLQPSTTHWPCAWINLLQTRNDRPPQPAMTCVSSGFPASATAAANPSDLLLCKPAPASLLIFPAKGTRQAGCAAGRAVRPWLSVPYDLVQDVVVSSESCLLVHLSRKPGQGGHLGSDPMDEVMQHHQDVSKCAMEERVRNTVGNPLFIVGTKPGGRSVPYSRSH